MNRFPRHIILLLSLLLNITAGAQTTITTNYTNAPGGNILLVNPSYVTFTVSNANTYAVAITAIGNQHIATATITGPPVINYSQNNARYALWYHETGSAAAPIDAGNGWRYADSSATGIVTATNGVVQVISGIKDAIVPPGKTYTFALMCSDSISAAGNGAPTPFPGSFTIDNVTLSTTGLPWGAFPNGGQLNGQAFNGSITFNRAVPKPQVSITPKKQQLCIGDNVTLTATAETYVSNPSFTWKYNGNVVGSGTTYSFTVDNTNTGLYTCIVTEGLLNSIETEINISATMPPAPTVDGKFDYCLNEPFLAVIVNGTNPKWYYEPATGSPVPVVPTLNTSAPNTLVYYVSQTDQYGCESKDRTLVRLRAAAKPVKPITTTPIYYCAEVASDQLTAIGDALKWYYQPTGGVHTILAPTPNTSVMDSFQYFVTQTVNGCESDRKKIDVVVTFKPNGKILLDKNELCAEDSIIIGYYGSAYVGSAYNWQMPAVGARILNGGFDQGPITVQLNKAGKFQVKLRVGHEGCQSDLYTEDVTVRPLPYGIISTKNDICLGQSELVESTSFTPELDSFNWDFDNGVTSHYTTQQGPYGIQWNEAGEKIIKVTLIDNGCTETIEKTIVVHPKPDATITAEITDGTGNIYTEGDMMCSSDSLKLSVAKIEPGASYKWTPDILFGEYSNDAVTYARVDHNSALHVAVEDIYGCKNESAINVLTKPCCEMTFPNAFTPNNDGRNDKFRPITVGRREIKTFKVVNRYGQVVFESKNPGHNWGWDGQMNGKVADMGTYHYIISFMCDNKPVDQSGEVILVR